MSVEKAHELLLAAADDGRVLGTDPQTGHEIVARAGRYGPYVTEVLPEADEPPKRGAKKVKPRTGSLFQDMDLASIDLETALRLTDYLPPHHVFWLVANANHNKARDVDPDDGAGPRPSGPARP